MIICNPTYKYIDFIAKADIVSMISDSHLNLFEINKLKGDSNI